MTQGESKLSRQFIHEIKARGGYAFKIHGGPTQPAGLPDVCGVYKGFSLWIETKLPEGGEPTPIQLHRHDELRRAGALVYVARTLSEVREILRKLDRQYALAAGMKLAL